MATHLKGILILALCLGVLGINVFFLLVGEWYWALGFTGVCLGLVCWVALIVEFVPAIVYFAPERVARKRQAEFSEVQ